MEGDFPSPFPQNLRYMSTKKWVAAVLTVQNVKGQNIPRETAEYSAEPNSCLFVLG